MFRAATRSWSAWGDRPEPDQRQQRQQPPDRQPDALQRSSRQCERRQTANRSVSWPQQDGKDRVKENTPRAAPNGVAFRWKMPPAPSPNHQTPSAQTIESDNADLHDLSHTMPKPITNWIVQEGVRENRCVVNDRSVPGDRVGDPTRIPSRQPVQHPAEAIGSAGEHERLDLETASRSQTVARISWNQYAEDPDAVSASCIAPLLSLAPGRAFCRQTTTGGSISDQTRPWGEVNR